MVVAWAEVKQLHCKVVLNDFSNISFEFKIPLNSDTLTLSTLVENLRFEHVPFVRLTESFEELEQIFNLYKAFRKDYYPNYTNIKRILDEVTFIEVNKYKLSAVKLIKNTFLIGLREAKDFVEQYLEENDQ